MKKINESFTCGNCWTRNIPANATCRNHCTNCLWSQHLDDQIPGDRKANCGGLMEPIGIDYNQKKGNIIVHKCQICGNINKNKVLEDDNLEAFLAINKI